jgi:hypothetical protein
MRHLIALVAAAGLLAGGASPAAADRVVETYDLTYTGQATYDRHDVFPEDDGRVDWTFDAAFTWDASADGVTFVNGRLQAPRDTDVELQVQSAGSDFTHVHTNGTDRGSCSGTTAEDPGNGVLADFPVVNGTRTLSWEPLSEVLIPMPCTGVLAPGPLTLALGSGLSGLEAIWEVPPAAQGAGQVIELVQKPADALCPLRTAATTSCDWDWNGQITMTRTSRQVVRDPKPAPPPPPPPPPAPKTPADIAREAIEEELQRMRSEDALVKSVDDAVKQYLDNERIAGDIQTVFQRETARVRVNCPATCSGSVKAYGASGPRSRGSGKPLASGTFKTGRTTGPRARAAAAARTATATLRFNRGARRRLARHRYVALRIAMRFAGAPGVQRTTLTVRVPRR